MGWDSKEKKWRLIKEMHTFKKWLRNGARLHFSVPLKKRLPRYARNDTFSIHKVASPLFMEHKHLSPFHENEKEY